MFLSVIIPAYNEEERIKETLLQTSNFLIRQQYNYEIILVNDGSSDATVKLVKGLKIKNIKIINNIENYGKGYAVKVGLLNAVGKYRLFMDADNSTSIEEINNFLPYVSECDIIIASRSKKDSHILNPQPYYRRVLGCFFSVLVVVITGLKGIKDTQCGFKLLSAKAVDRILPKCNIVGWAFDVEILIIAEKLGFKIKEIPVMWSNNSKTKVRFLGMATMIFDLLKIRYNLIPMNYEIKN